MHSSQTLSGAALSLWLLAPVGSAVAVEDAFDPCAAIRAAVAGLEKDHISHRPLDDELSRQWLQTFLDRLDPGRMYFRQSDVREFRRFEERLDDLAADGDFRFAQRVRKRYRQRTQEAATRAEELLAVEQDYSIDESLPLHYEDYAATGNALRERWRLQLKGELLIEKLHGRPLDEVQSQLAGRYRRIARQAREMNDERLCQIYLDSLASLYDAHTAYFSPTLLTSFSSWIRIRTYRPGLVFQPRAGRLTITSIDPSLRDRETERRLLTWQLLAVRRVDGTVLDVVEMHPDDFYDMIRWPTGPLESDTEILLELFNPVTYERATVSWSRFGSF